MIMGRLTYESIGKALPGRRSIVLTRQVDFQAEGCEVVATAAEATAAAGDVEEFATLRIFQKLIETIKQLGNRPREGLLQLQQQGCVETIVELVLDLAD